MYDLRDSSYGSSAAKGSTAVIQQVQEIQLPKEKCRTEAQIYYQFRKCCHFCWHHHCLPLTILSEVSEGIVVSLALLQALIVWWSLSGILPSASEIEGRNNGSGFCLHVTSG